MVVEEIYFLFLFAFYQICFKLYTEKAFSGKHINLKESLDMGASTNQRTETRFGCYVPVEGKEGGEFDQTKTIDISRHGIGFLTSQPVGINQKIAVEIVLKENTQPVMVVGVVKWIRRLQDSDQYRVGMVFSEVISGSDTRLDKYFTSKRWE